MQNHNSKFKISGILKKAADFHGHLGPYLVLGLRMGNLAMANLKCKKYFGIRAEVEGALQKPKSCLVDGIQVTTGCTYGKGNIQKKSGCRIRAAFYNLENNKKIKIFLKKGLIKKLDNLKGRRDSELFALKLFTSDPRGIFEIRFGE